MLVLNFSCWIFQIFDGNIYLSFRAIAWFSLATQAQAQAQTQAIGMTQVKRNSTQPQAQAKPSEPSGILENFLGAR